MRFLDWIRNFFWHFENELYAGEMYPPIPKSPRGLERVPGSPVP